MAVAGAWALTSGIGPLETARTALFIAPGGAESRPESSPGDSFADCGFAVQLEGVPGLARIFVGPPATGNVGAPPRAK